MKFRMKATQRNLVVVCNHSLSSNNWRPKLNRQTVLESCVQFAQQTHGADTPEPQATILCGDFTILFDAVSSLMHAAVEK